MSTHEASAIDVGGQSLVDTGRDGAVVAGISLDVCDAGVDVGAEGGVEGDVEGDVEGKARNHVLPYQGGVGTAVDVASLIVAREQSEASVSDEDATMSEESNYDDVMRQNAIAMRDLERYEKMSEWQHRLALVKNTRSGMKLLLDDFPDIFYLHGCDVMKSLEYRFDTRLDDHVVPDEEYSFAWDEDVEASEEAGAEAGAAAGEEAGEEAGEKTDGVGQTLDEEDQHPHVQPCPAEHAPAPAVATPPPVDAEATSTDDHETTR